MYWVVISLKQCSVVTITYIQTISFTSEYTLIDKHNVKILPYSPHSFYMRTFHRFDAIDPLCGGNFKTDINLGSPIVNGYRRPEDRNHLTWSIKSISNHKQRNILCIIFLTSLKNNEHNLMSSIESYLSYQNEIAGIDNVTKHTYL